MNDLRIAVADNGMILSFDDPEVRKKNRESDKGWEDPTRQRVYETPEALLADLKVLLPLLHAEPPADADDYETAIKVAFKEASVK